VYQLLSHGRWFSPGTPASSTTKTGRQDIAEILLKVALSTINQIKSIKSTFLPINYISKLKRFILEYSIHHYLSSEALVTSDPNSH
jgi:hypothetical protein